MAEVKKRKKDPAAVALRRKGGQARAAKLTPAQRSESARKAVRARWAKVSKSGSPIMDTTKKALHACLKRIKDAKTEDELRSLTEALQRIVFRRQYTSAED